MSILQASRPCCRVPTSTPTSPPRPWPDLPAQDRCNVAQVIAGLLRRQLSLHRLAREESRHADDIDRA